jgi:tripartite-type tricarboxylate transporter receptor subunit TctC
VHFVVGLLPGGPVDTVARIVSDWLSQQLGQPFVVESRAGSGGMILGLERQIGTKTSRARKVSLFLRGRASAERR